MHSTPARVAQAGAAEFVAQEAVVEAGIVRDEELALEPCEQVSAISAKAGASATMSSVMPVSAWMVGGIRRPGFTSVDHSPTLRPRSTSIRPTSVTRS